MFLNKPTNITGGHHPVGAFLLNIHHSKLEHVGLCALRSAARVFYDSVGFLLWVWMILGGFVGVHDVFYGDIMRISRDQTVTTTNKTGWSENRPEIVVWTQFYHRIRWTFQWKKSQSLLVFFLIWIVLLDDYHIYQNLSSVSKCLLVSFFSHPFFDVKMSNPIPRSLIKHPCRTKKNGKKVGKFQTISRWGA